MNNQHRVKHAPPSKAWVATYGNLKDIRVLELLGVEASRNKGAKVGLKATYLLSQHSHIEIWEVFEAHTTFVFRFVKILLFKPLNFSLVANSTPPKREDTLFNFSHKPLGRRKQLLIYVGIA